MIILSVDCLEQQQGLTADYMTLAKDIEKRLLLGAVPRSTTEKVERRDRCIHCSGQNDRADMTLHVAKSLFSSAFLSLVSKYY